MSVSAASMRAFFLCLLLAPNPVTSARLANPLETEVIREKVQDGVTGETRELQYTQCKIVGNGSFGVVFQTKLSPSGEDAAIKRVLQDKRFKVPHSSASVTNLHGIMV